MHFATDLGQRAGSRKQASLATASPVSRSLSSPIAARHSDPLGPMEERCLSEVMCCVKTKETPLEDIDSGDPKSAM